MLKAVRSLYLLFESFSSFQPHYTAFQVDSSWPVEEYECWLSQNHWLSNIEKKKQKLKVLSNPLKSVDLSCLIQSAPFRGNASKIRFKVSFSQCTSGEQCLPLSASACSRLIPCQFYSVWEYFSSVSDCTCWAMFLFAGVLIHIFKQNGQYLFRNVLFRPS